MKLDNADTAAAPEPIMGDEFPEGAADAPDGPSRRRFLTVMGASVALATGAGCNIRPAPQRHILPYTTQPDELTPGIPLFFASAATLGGYGTGVLVRSHEGRPIKVEGNPDHPASLGGASIHALASVLDLYDPDRSRGVTHRGIPAGYDEALAALRAKLYAGRTANAGLRLRVVTETVTSPTLGRLITKLLEPYADAKWVAYDAVGAAAGPKGAAHRANYDFLKADVVLALDADFLLDGPGHVRYSRDFADRRKIRHDGKDAAAVAAVPAFYPPGTEFKEGVTPDQVSRLYAVETMPTNTGSVADHRLPLLNSQAEAFARALAAELGVAGAPAAGALPDAAKAWLKPLAADLNAHKGKSVVVAGEHAPAALHALAFAINAHLGNVGTTVRVTASPVVSVDGKMSDLKTLTAEMAKGQVDALLVLGAANPAYTAPADVDFAAALMAMGRDDTKLTLHLGQHQDETGVLCAWHVNEAHYLEAWGDVRGHDGTAAIQQPLIAPLHGGKSAIDLLAAVVKGPQAAPEAKSDASVPTAPRDALEVVQATWRDTDAVKKAFPGFQKPAVFETFWQEVVRSGVVPGTASPAATATPAPDLAAGTPAPAIAAGEYEINFRADPTLYDGRFANNGWLQELPKPLTKLTWDNAAFVSPATAVELGVKKDFRWTAGEHGRAEVGVVEIAVGDRKVKAPVWALPGHPDGAVTVHLGYGRDGGRAGRVAHTPDEPNADGQPRRGFNAYLLRTAAAPWTAAAKLTKIDDTYFLACTQGHWAAAEKDRISGKLLDRKPVRHGTIADYQKNKAFAKIPPMAAGETEGINDNIPHPAQHHDAHGAGGHDTRLHPLNMYAPAEGLVPNLKDAQRRRWGMAIDLSACTGCSACVIACQGENNIPVVGKEQVTKGREMHWIRIDRYYDGTQDAPNAAGTYFQPVMCVQCENAPCEIVCPVGATVHSADGLNDMVYNRCVGTRYCSNNCPYKVRRFNFLSFQDWETDTLKLGRNPEVSVRSRGVMEKCTFCVQRIRGAEIVAERELAQGLRKLPGAGESLIRDGEVVTACQAACPSAAIVFGDLNDADSAVSRWKNEPANYGLLAELNTRPRVTHLADIRNPNPNLK